MFPDRPARVDIERLTVNKTRWEFKDAYAGIVGLGNRIQTFRAFDNAGRDIVIRKISPGYFEAANAPSKLSYEVNIAPSMNPDDAAKVSWSNNERGLLMLRDLLPQLTLNATSGEVAADIALELPNNWRAYSNDAPTGARQFSVSDCDSTVIAIGKNLRQSSRAVSDATLSFIAGGNWAFADDDAVDLAAKVLKTHREVFGSMPSRRVQVNLYPFPQTVSPNKWAAETRGSTVTLLIGKYPSKVAALMQLSTPLTHELFHFWVPNSLALAGDYDWFYEGFTVYQAARTAVRLDLLTFEEFLNAIGRAYDTYQNPADRDHLSLLEASKRRWTSGQASVYSKSMVVAFIYDLKLRSQTRGKRSLDNVYRTLFDRYRASRSDANTTDGNTAVRSGLESEAAMQDFVRTFIAMPVAINLQNELAPYGLKAETFRQRTRISVNDKLSKQQRDLLRQLGYNDATHAPRSK